MASWKKYEKSTANTGANGIKSETNKSISFLNGNINSEVSSGVKVGKKGEDIVPFKAGVDASGNLVEGKISGSYGNASGEGDLKIGSAAVKGEVKTTLMENGKFSPSVGGSVKANVTAIEGSLKGKYGNDDYNINANVKGQAGTAGVELGGSAGKIKYKDEKSGQEVETWGMQGKAGVEAYAVKGSIAGGVTIAGIKFNMALEGKAGGAGASAEGHVTTGGIGGSLSVGALVGAGLSMSVDWSGVKVPSVNDILNINKSKGGKNKSTGNTIQGGKVLGKAVFEIKPNSVKIEAENLKQAANKLKQQSERINSIKNHLEIKGMSAIRIKKTISDINNDIRDDKKKLEKLSQTLTDITKLYVDTENSIMSDIK